MAPRSPPRGCVARLGLRGVVLAAAALSSAALPLPPNNQPVIGVLAVPIGNECITAWQETRQSDAAATNQSGGGRGGGDNDALGSCFHSLYVQWLESAGARVVPIPYDAPVDDLDHLLASVNGVLFTGGEVELHNLTSPYMNTARRVLTRSVTLAGSVAGAGAAAAQPVAGSTGAGAASPVGTVAPASAAASTTASVGKSPAASAVGIAAAAPAEPFPVWGTCMGFQTLVVLAAEDPAILTEGVFDSEGLALPLQLTAAGRASRLWGGLRPHVQDVLENENVTCNLHHDGIFATAFASNAKVAAAYTLVSTNVDRKGQRFVSTLEHRTAPVFATQWHPERPQFQFSVSAGESGGINHGPAAVEAMQAVANFFVAQARKSSQRFANQTELAARLIYNDVPRGPLGDSYRAYVFPPQR